MAGSDDSTKWLLDYLTSQLATHQHKSMRAVLTALNAVKNENQEDFKSFSKNFASDVMAGSFMHARVREDERGQRSEIHVRTDAEEHDRLYILDRLLSCLAFSIPDEGRTEGIQRALSLDDEIYKRLHEISDMIQERDELVDKHGIVGPGSFPLCLVEAFKGSDQTGYISKAFENIFYRFDNPTHWPTTAEFMRKVADMNGFGCTLTPVELGAIQARYQQSKSRIYRALWQESADIIDRRYAAPHTGDLRQIQTFRLSDSSTEFLAWVYATRIADLPEAELNEESAKQARKRLKRELAKNPMHEEEERLLRAL